MDIIVKMVTSVQFISSIVIILVTIIATLVIEHTHKLYVKKTNNTVQMNAIVRSTFRLMKTVTWIIAALAVLEVNNIRVLMGMHIINDKAFKVGDVIKIDDDEGIVTLFTLQTTQYTSLNTGDNVTICNRNITKVGITNGVYDIDIGLRYDEDPEHVREVLTDCAKKIKAIKGIKNSEYLAVQSFDATSAIYRIRYWCKPKDKWVTRRAAMGVLQKCLLESDIVLPYSQLDVHVNDSDGK